MTSFLSILLLRYIVRFCLFLASVASYEICSNETGNGICPNGNTCCRLPDGRSGCIASDMGRGRATCCQDNPLTGCPVGYECRLEEQDCRAWNTSKNPFADPLTMVLPRYRLCHAHEIEEVYGLPVNSSFFLTNDYEEKAEIAYYSNMGPLEQINASSVEMALIAVHGAGRNGDDYFCSGKATVELQDRFTQVLVIAPNFFSASDDRPKESLLYWDSKDKDGSWRYGANSIGPVSFSSFAALDQLIFTIQKRFVQLQMITVAGHSSGGQLVQRWSLLSSATQENDSPFLQIVVANPSNYAYMSPLRFIDGAWRRPDDTTNDSCIHYDQWEWGLSGGGDFHVPYRDHALANTTAVLQRYRTQNVLYLVGSLDRCNVSESRTTGWCNSHGLETKCMDQLQGTNRFERNARFLASLDHLGFGRNHHRRVVVPGVGHDHSLMFQSPEGIQAIYYGMSPRGWLNSKQAAEK
jgi:hypothetical protein